MNLVGVVMMALATLMITTLVVKRGIVLCSSDS